MLAVHLSKHFAQSIDLSMLKKSELLDMVLLLLCQLKVSSNSKTEVKTKKKPVEVFHLISPFLLN